MHNFMKLTYCLSNLTASFYFVTILVVVIIVKHYHFIFYHVRPFLSCLFLFCVHENSLSCKRLFSDQ